MANLTTVSGKSVQSEQVKPFAVHHQFLIIGGGSAGITVAAQLQNGLRHPDVAIIDPAETHFYQPMWTFSGAGVIGKENSQKPMEKVIPGNTAHIKDFATGFEPDRNLVLTGSGTQYSYDYLIVAPGIQIDWDAIPGLAEGLGKNELCSIYSYQNLNYVEECIKKMTKGTALFTQPATKFKCGGAPQKIMYLAGDTWRKKGVLENIDIRFTTAGTVIFGVKEIAEALQPVIKRYGVNTDFTHNLKAIKVDEKIAVYDLLKDGKPVDEKEIAFDMLHVTPPMSSPDFIKQSPIADAEGWVDVDKHTLRHNRYPNIFSLGDAGSTPNAKTGAAIRKQSKVVTGNLISMVKNGEIDKSLRYDGYGSCPLITGFGKLILAEFDYDNKMTPSFPINQAKERWSMYHMKKDLLPKMYWYGMLKGRA
jgi:sulfide:quinone oxidoreductase